MVEKEDIEAIAWQSLGLKTGWQIRDLDSFMLVDLLVQLERKFSIIFEIGEWEDLTSLDDLVDLVNKKIKQS